ncbi:MAG TPA: hypothetical protein VG186_16775, partial [Solirubrobacteraceae bacterium]|nr:hypothetical protein [Solirubrobacteraceae bacterium]
DAWDVMTSGRPYSEAKSVDEAISECTRMVSSQFTKPAVGALLKLHASGELDPTSQSTRSTARRLPADGGRSEPRTARDPRTIHAAPLSDGE